MLGPEGLKALADLPSRDALRAQLVGAVAGAAGPLVGLLERCRVTRVRPRGAGKSAIDESGTKRGAASVRAERPG